MLTRRKFAGLVAGAVAASLTRRSAASALKPSGKRGACFTTKQGSGWLNRIDALNPSWMYSWGAFRPDTLPSVVEFTPMIWGNSSVDKLTSKIDRLRESKERGEVRALLGFNEPDQESQSDMTVERVVELWPMLMDLGVPLVSPGCVHPDREWMQEFMEEVERRDLRVDAIAVHSYGGPDAEHLVRRLERVSRKYGRPIWLTEFAVGDWKAKRPEKNRFRPEKIATFMKEILPALDAAPFVERYAWFSASQESGPLGTSALFDGQGKLTDLGRLYAQD